METNQVSPQESLPKACAECSRRVNCSCTGNPAFDNIRVAGNQILEPVRCDHDPRQWIGPYNFRSYAP